MIEAKATDSSLRFARPRPTPISPTTRLGAELVPVQRL